MTRWTEDQLDEYMAKRDRISPLPSRKDLDEPDEGPESKLQAKIVKWCKDWGRPCQSNRQTARARTILTPGWPDITIIQSNSKVLFLELKSAKGRISPEQCQIKLMFMALGHEVHEVRSYKQFLTIAMNP